MKIRQNLINLVFLLMRKMSVLNRFVLVVHNAAITGLTGYKLFMGDKQWNILLNLRQVMIA